MRIYAFKCDNGQSVRLGFLSVMLYLSLLDFYASQQFQSYNWDSHDDANERTKETTSPFSYCTPGFVSRQRLILIDVKDKEVENPSPHLVYLLVI